MILENGVIRTLDPALPVARALAVAGERIAGGVGTHERELASPDRVDLGGRCVLPGFTDSHVHFMQWAIAQRQVRLEGTANLEEAVARVADAAASASRGGWIRGTGWRSGDWSPAVAPTGASRFPEGSSRRTSTASRRACSARSPPGGSGSGSSTGRLRPGSGSTPCGAGRSWRAPAGSPTLMKK